MPRGGATFKAVGDIQLIKQLDKLDNAVRTRIGRRAAKTAMVPVIKKSKSLIKENKSDQSGALRSSIGGKQKVFRGISVVHAYVGPRTGDKYNREWKGRIRIPWRYGHLVEFGTRWGGWRNFPTQPKPFQRPALLTQKSKVVKILGSELGRRITEQAKKK